jgi:23S rRNA (cytosine1962-C5)-methyltransferase
VSLPLVSLAPGRDRSLRERHPWVFSGAIARVEGDPAPGSSVEVRSSRGEFLARGAWSPASQLAVRVWTFDPAEAVTAEFLSARLAASVAARGAGAGAPGAACRLVHAESDGLPGLVVDRYADWLVCQISSAGAEFWREVWVAALASTVRCAGIYERSDVEIRRKEGLDLRTGALHGAEPPATVEIAEGRCRFLVDLRAGHKTGFYLDQRDNRALVAEHAAGARVLNGFAYTGAFGIAALHGGAERVVEIDSSAPALELGRRNLELNGFAAARVESLRGNAFEVLRSLRDAGREFDLAVLDPPRLAESRSQVTRASRAYKDANLLALKLLRPGGLLFTFSCSGHVDAWLFEQIVAGAALDAGRPVQVLRRLGPPADHPALLGFPEGSYLKGLLCRAG